MKSLLFVAVEHNEQIADAETVATALDRILKAALSTPGVLDDVRNPRISEFFAFPEEELQAAAQNLGALQQQVAAIKSALAISRVD